MLCAEVELQCPWFVLLKAHKERCDESFDREG